MKLESVGSDDGPPERSGRSGGRGAMSSAQGLTARDALSRSSSTIGMGSQSSAAAAAARRVVPLIVARFVRLMSLLGLLAVAGCGVPPPGEPMPDAGDAARRLRSASATTEPTRVTFEWEYADRSGSFRGEGVARVNPPDRFRIDLFSTGEGSMQATLVDGRLATSGDLEGVDLPPVLFLYAMAGIFRPGSDAPRAGAERQQDRGLRLEYGDSGGTARYFDFVGGRLVRVEERRGRRRERWIELDWGEADVAAAWPREARYTDEPAGSGVRWELLTAHVEPEPFDERIYGLPR